MLATRAAAGPESGGQEAVAQDLAVLGAVGRTSKILAPAGLELMAQGSDGGSGGASRLALGGRPAWSVKPVCR
jgi:hypothetical protein